MEESGANVQAFSGTGEPYQHVSRQLSWDFFVDVPADWSLMMFGKNQKHQGPHDLDCHMYYACGCCCDCSMSQIDLKRDRPKIEVKWNAD